MYVLKAAANIWVIRTQEIPSDIDGLFYRQEKNNMLVKKFSQS